MQYDKKEDQENKGNEENLPKKDDDLHKEIKNANASGMGSLGRSDETIEKRDSEESEEHSTPY